MLATTIFTLTGVGVAIAFGSTRYFTAMQNVGQVKSSVDDLTMERGTVSMRVAFVLRSAEVQPLFRDLCDSFLTSKCYSDAVANSFLPFWNIYFFFDRSISFSISLITLFWGRTT
jgi:hypothetical protein